jgi:cell wall-associated NlpC family hydrolase
VLEKVNSYWYKITDKSKVTGYISTSPQYISTTFGQTPDEDTNEEEGEEATFPAPPNATVVSSVAFRSGPDTDASRIRYLQSGEKLLIISKTNNYWYKVQDQNSVTGYVSTSSKYISSTFVEPYKQLDPATAAQKVIDAGMHYLGTPYEFGSSRSDTSTFDCSDLVRQAYLEGIGQQLPGDSRSQWSYVAAVGKTSTDWHQLKRGDLMFFMSYKGSSASSYAGIDKASEKITHVGIYLGNGQVLHTYSQASGGVRIDSFAGTAWEYRFLQGGSTY